MKEIRKIIRLYVSDKAEIPALPVKQWFITEHQELWDRFKEEAAEAKLMSIIKGVFNEHVRPLKDNWTQMEFRLREKQKVVTRIPTLPRHVHDIDPEDGTATYYPWEDATDRILAVDEAFSRKQSQDCAQRAEAISEFRRYRDSLGIAPDVTFSQHLDALSQ